MMLSFYLSAAAVAQKCSRRYETCKDNIFISHQIFVHGYHKLCVSGLRRSEVRTIEFVNSATNLMI